MTDWLKEELLRYENFSKYRRRSYSKMNKLLEYLKLQNEYKDYINIKALIKDIEDGDFND